MPGKRLDEMVEESNDTGAWYPGKLMHDAVEDMENGTYELRSRRRDPHHKMVRDQELEPRARRMASHHLQDDNGVAHGGVSTCLAVLAGVALSCCLHSFLPLFFWGPPQNLL